MKTLSEKNEDLKRDREWREARKHLTNVACDKCGTEMHYTHPGVSHAFTHYTVRYVHCPKCRHKGEIRR